MALSHDQESFDLESLRSKCSSKLNVQKQEFFEFSEQSIVSNLYWGIENIEAAIQAMKRSEDNNSKLKEAEKMLQAPALLNEQGFTARISNCYLVCCSYFYLSVVRKLQSDELQVAIHFLQALLVSPTIVHTEFAPELCRSIYLSCTTSVQAELGSKRALKLDFQEKQVCELMKWIARRYKAWLMYYQVMSYGETPGSLTLCKDSNGKSEHIMNMKSSSTESSSWYEHAPRLRTYQNFEKVHPFDPQKNITTSEIIPEFQKQREVLTVLHRVSGRDITKSSDIKCLQDMLNESESGTPTSLDSDNGNFTESEGDADDSKSSLRTVKRTADDLQAETFDKKHQAPRSKSNLERAISMTQAPRNLSYKEATEVNITKFFSGRCSSSLSELDLSKLELEDIELHTFWNYYVAEETTPQNYQISQMDQQESFSSHPEKDYQIEQAGVFEKVISRLCFSDGLGNCEEDSTVEITTVYETLASKTGLKYSLLKDVILDQLLMAISTSKEERVTRASVSILSSIVSRNQSAIADIKKKGLQLCDLANALKRNVYEAAILIHLINPSPTEIKTLELLPTLVEIVCTSNSYMSRFKSILVTPPSASLMMIEVLVTAFDYSTNNMHLAAISSPKVLSCLINVPRNDNLEEFISLAAILVRCMRFDGQCRKYISQFTPISPFISLLISNQKHATFVALEFFHEILCMPRSSAIRLLQKIREEGSINIICVLLLAIQQPQLDYKLLAANLLLQLNVLEDSSDKLINMDAAIEALLESLAWEENSAAQQLSAFILSNLGGTYTWTGEPYTIAWLVKKTGLTSLQHRNIIRNCDWSDHTLQDNGIDTWCGKIAQQIIKLGNPVFRVLEKGLKSKSKRVCKDCLTAIAWLGCEIVKSPEDLRCSACEILLSTIEQYVHPGLELEERLLACLCIYNYTYGRGMQKLIQLSEGVRESLRRLSSTTWMAEELLKVADYFLPNKWRISCVHTQILEASHKGSGAVSSLIYYSGHLCSGYADGSIKVWDIKGQTATLVSDTKEHRKAVTCFSLFEPGNCLLSGSADKTIRIWKMVEGKLQSIEIITTKDHIRSLDTTGELIFAITHSHKMKVIDTSRIVKDLCKSKHVKSMRASPGKVYIGCMDSSIQELAITNNRQQELKAPSKSWIMQNRPINSIEVYKDWLYSASTSVEGSKIKEWRRQSKPQMSIVQEKRANVLAMCIVEDFMYLHCSSSTNSIEVWLRGAQHKVGRLSAGSKITSLLTANDMILCGTETGLIKGWIPL